MTTLLVMVVHSSDFSGIGSDVAVDVTAVASSGIGLAGMAEPFCLVRPHSTNTVRNRPTTGHFKAAAV